MNVSKSEIRSDINVTPLVDVCLVLLIIFMVVTPLLGKGANVAVPQTRKPEAMPEKREQILLEVQADGGIVLACRRLSPGELRHALADLPAKEPDRPVIVKADRHLRYQEVLTVLRTASEAKFAHAGLVTERRPLGS